MILAKILKVEGPKTKPGHAEAIVALRHDWTLRPWSEPSLETLAIVALKQPLPTGEINAICRLNSSGRLRLWTSEN